MVNSSNSSANHDDDQQSKKLDQHPDSPGQADMAEVDEEDWAETSVAGEEDPGATAEEVGEAITHHKWGDSPPDVNKDLD